MTIVIRRMQPEDIDQVMVIEEQVVEFPWTHSIFSDCIKVGYSCWVIVDTDTVIDKNKEVPEILGYALLSMAAEEAHVLNICIKPERQGQGLGKSLMQHLIVQAKLLHAKLVYLEVRVSNDIAYDLYIKLGFIVIGERKDYYPAKDGREDALVLQLTLDTHRT